MSVGRRGDTVYTGRNGVRETLLREKDKLAKSPSGTHGAVVGPSRLSIREAVLAGICPFCGRDYMGLAVHTHRAHAVSADELKDLAGLPKSAAACHPSHSETMRISSLRSMSPENLEAMQAGRRANAGKPRNYSEAGRAIQAEKVRAARRSDAWKAGTQRAIAGRRAAIIDRDAEITRRALGGESLESLAAAFAIHTRTVKKAVERSGVSVDFRKHAAVRRGPTSVTKAKLANLARLESEKVARLRRYAELGGDWNAVRELAKERGVTAQSMAAYLRTHGATVPDSRTAPQGGAECAASERSTSGS